MASFPNAVKSFAPRSAGQTIASAIINDLQDEVTAIEDGLINGTAPINSSAASVASLSVASSTVKIGQTTYILPSTGGQSGQYLSVGSTSGSTNTLVWGAGPSIFDRGMTAVNVNNTTSVTTVYTVPVPGNTLSSNRGLRLTLIGDYLGSNGGADLITAVKYGGVTVVASTNTLTGSANRQGVRYQVDLVAAGSANAQVAFGRLVIGLNAGSIAGSLGNAAIDVMGANTGLSVDATTTQTLAVSVQHSVANSTISFRHFTTLVELT